MLIIVEGCDGAGKTTVCDRLDHLLTTEFGYTVLRTSAGVPEPGQDPYDTYERQLPDPRGLGSVAVVADRWHWGEPVYGPIMRGNDTLGLAGFRHVELYVKSRGAVVLLLTNDVKVLRDRINERGDQYVMASQVQEIQAGYEALIEKTGVPILRETDPTIGALRTVIKFGRALASFVNPLRNFTSYVGSPTPDVLLVGERRNGDPNQPDKAAFVPRPTTSGRFLIQALERDFWNHVGLVNAYEDNVADLVKVLEYPKVVALGRKAYDQLKNVWLVDCGAVPHPQYIRRFHHVGQVAYGRKIAEVSRTQEVALSWRP